MSLTACETEPVRPLSASEGEQLRTIASAALQLELDIENLRPFTQALKGRSWSEGRLDEIHGHLEKVAEWLAVAGELGDYQWLGPASAMVHLGGLEYDLIRIDLEATARGFGGTIHETSSIGVTAGLAAMQRLHEDPDWVSRSPQEVADAINLMLRCRMSAGLAAPATNVLKSGVVAASIYTGAFSVVNLARAAPGALARLIAWLEGAGQPAALVATVEGGGVAIQAVAGAGSITVTVAEVEALVGVGALSATAHMLFAMARGSYHHILTDKNYVSGKTGGPWSPLFEDFLKKAGLKFSDPANQVWVEGHAGPHPLEYHQEVYDRLIRATRGLKAGTPEYREAVLNLLKQLGKEIQTKGSRLNLLIARGKL
ncbi:MAG TPA: AHH domain-containing protein [Myxococcaceae bacterium]|nr:AHH domain-containing protein [Myxococcaceae bacterium]